ncbi:MAG: AAA family ATPase [Bacteroidales bacterium]|nr:AAA family ATPase [Bacteroidales bacterium]
MKKTNNRKPQMSLLDAVETVAIKANDSQLSKEFMASVKKEVKFLAKSFDITDLQACLFCVCVEVGPSDVDYMDLARYLDTSKIAAMKYVADMEALVRRRLLGRDHNTNDDSFCVRPTVLRMLMHNEVYELPDLEGLDVVHFFDEVNVLFENLCEENITIGELKTELADLMMKNSQLDFVRQLKAYGLGENDELFVVYFCAAIVCDDTFQLRVRLLKRLVENKSEWSYIIASLRNNNHSLLTSGILEFACEDGMENNELLQLSNDARRALLSGILPVEPTRIASDIIECKKVTEKHLFYSDELQRKIDDLCSVLSPERYRQVCQRMKDKGFHSGVTCILYGGPGTGKTETVYQLAHRTGRDIMLVDIPSIRSKWVGETEKNIKDIFVRYRSYAKDAKEMPILLFNEADAIFGNRLTDVSKAVDKMENAMQNIILQEMEAFDGILIATTNLQQNLDAAFERRFLFKIKFEKPVPAARMSIWHEMIPELNDEVVRILASKYDFSGGQIENVARHYNIDSILHGAPNDVLATLTAHCNDERLDNGMRHKKVGF